jgi:hypothetical protein
MKKPALFFMLLLLVSALWAQNRYALVIGNADYSAGNELPNAKNDAQAIYNALWDLGYKPELRPNLGWKGMDKEIEAFVNLLRSNGPNSEGFFWCAGHGMEIDGENYLLGLDVDTDSTNTIKKTSYSVTDLIRELERARNKINIVVLDTCRVPPGVGGRGRDYGDTARVIKTIPEPPSDVVIAYSTTSGTKADDGPQGGLSPYAQAFLNNMMSTEPLYIVLNLIGKETSELTGGNQTPRKSGNLMNNPRYSLNPSGQVVGAISVTSAITGEILINGQLRTTIKAGDTEIISNIKIGWTEVAVKEANGAITKAQQTVLVQQGQTVSVPIERPVPEGLAFEVVGGKNVTITKYSGNAKTVIIPERIQGLPVTRIGDWAFNGCSSLTGVTIPSSVTTIGDWAFNGCSSLTSITIPSSVTTIGDWAFNGCSSLTSITIPSSVTAIGDYAFNFCSSLTSVTIPSSVRTIGWQAFYGCSSLTGITIPSSVTAIEEGAFLRCSSLIGITVDSKNPAYTSVDGVLFDKNVRTIIAYPGGKKGSYAIPSSVTAIGEGAFFDCSSLTGVTIPSSVTAIENYAFNNCSSLASVTLSRRTQVGKDTFPASTRISYSD